ncbi:uncharacterized protein LOC114842043 [Betta splendens]|uniref:Uncharacterized protein LOC114842043 n=1 Tax=Betta splendens TaxID=158456 RepID=A0A9W2X9Z1_BETSP|nr:uncharacterized protein LOC114842043 [Betta splendens]
MAAISSLITVPSRSYVYVPRERHVAPFSGDIDKDGRSVDEFIEEVERVLSGRNQSPPEQFDFVMSILRGSALEEVRLRKDEGSDQTSDLFHYLQEAFGDKRSASQLLQNFYSCKQTDGQNIRDFSHALSQTLSSVLKRCPNSLANERVALRDQFVEGLIDSSLRRDLRRYVRAHPDSSLIEVREEAYLWASEDLTAGTKGVKSKVRSGSYLYTDAQCTSVNAREKPVHVDSIMRSFPNQGQVSTSQQCNEKPVSLDDVVKLLAEQGKVITELTKAVKDLTTHNQNSVLVPDRAQAALKFTADGKPICYRCQTEGHIARQCPQRRRKATENSSMSGQQGNGSPWLQ